MKKLLLMAMFLVGALNTMLAQKQAEIKFDKLSIDLGTFPESQPIQKCVFEFTNVGNAPLIINQASATCGCTVATFTKEPVLPGQRGKIEVTYNGKKFFSSWFKKTIVVRTNAKPEVTRLVIIGEMVKDTKKTN